VDRVQASPNRARERVRRVWAVYTNFGRGRYIVPLREHNVIGTGDNGAPMELMEKPGTRRSDPGQVWPGMAAHLRRRVYNSRQRQDGAKTYLRGNIARGKEPEL
jgi:hypothetical protein